MIKFAKTTELKIDDNTFKIYHWPVSKVIKNMPRLARFFAVPFGTVAGASLGGNGNMQDALPTAILYMADQMDNEGAIQLMEMLLEGIEVNGMGGSINIDTLFEDNPMGLFELLAEILKVNYSCFFSKSGFGNLRNLMEQFGLIQQVQKLGESLDENQAP